MKELDDENMISSKAKFWLSMGRNINPTIIVEKYELEPIKTHVNSKTPY